ncbi:ABC transporter permease [Lachnoclostridium phytofermentans]|nr:ABC transporter permease [Lachnoclostridium phytofermentans]
MKNSAWNKNNRREIRHTLGRYIALLVIIALGVGFFSGLKITKQAMLHTGETYVKESNMYDYRLLSTLGFTAEDIHYISNLEGVNVAAGAVNVDFITDFNDKDDVVLKAHSITDDLNQITLVKGRLPEADNECVVDSIYFKEDDLGKTITVSAKNEEDVKNGFIYQDYTIVGLCNSVNYMYLSDRGTTKLAGGSINAFLYIPEGGFQFDYYSEIYVTLDNNQSQIFSKDYEDTVSAMEQPLKDAIDYRADLRYQDIITEANKKIAEAQSDYDASSSEYLDEKKEAKDSLSDSKKRLEDAKTEINSNEKKLADSERTLAIKEKEYNSSLTAYNNSKKDFDTKKCEIQNTLNEKQQEITANRSKVTTGMEEIEKSGVLNQYSTLKESEDSLKAALSQISDPNSTDYQTYANQLKQVEEGLGVINQYQTLSETLKQIKVAQDTLDTSKKTADSEFKKSEKELTLAKTQLSTAKETLVNSKKQIADGKVALDQAKKAYSEALQKYKDGKEDTDSALTEGEKKLAEAKDKISDAKAEVASLDKPSTYVLDRTKNISYASFENDSSVVEGIAKIFPIFFFLVAALVCSTTMTRMVDEHRTQIGTLKALGYSNRSIAWKYISYSGSAAVLGCILGYFAGIRLFPYAIWQAYKMLYNIAEIKYVFNGGLALLTLMVSLLCSVGATYAACRTELSQMPAELMRPKSPKVGKRIFLERIPVLWQALSFLHKVSIRNILRYKKRLFMMILGTGGCTALLLAGLGLNDSISKIADDQFGSIMLFDYTISFLEAQSKEEMTDFRESTSDMLSECVFISFDTYEVTGTSRNQKVNVVASDDPDITNVIGLRLNGKTVPFPEDGYVAINDRLAETENLKIGDSMTITLDNIKTYTVVIGGIFKNYAHNYMFMSEATYEKVFGEECAYKTAFATTDSTDIYNISAKLMKDHGASSVVVTADTKNRVTNMMNSLNYIVWLVIACACALSFVVMYNLSNINITERNREIATIKVLGFYPKETYSYVFRENIVITLISTMFGLPAGILLHRFVMDQIKIESISFNIQIFPISYLYALIVTIGLTLIVNVILIRKINRINMAESLKSVE